jgi:hypothetical protein
MNRIAIRTAAMLAAAALLLPSGCGSKNDTGAVIVKGKLVKDGQPFQAQLTGPKYPEGDGVGMAEVVLSPVKADNESIIDDNGDTTPIGVQSATVKPDGSFEVVGAKDGIPPGKYRFVIKLIDPLTEKDHLGNKYNERNSKVTRDIGGGQEIVIDLSKPGG